jgi:hypothetical protein
MSARMPSPANAMPMATRPPARAPAICRSAKAL